MDGIVGRMWNHEKYKGLDIRIKALVWFFLCNIIIKGINFIALPIFTRILPVEEFGELSIFTSFEQLILVIATWEVSIGPYQRGLFKYKNDIPFFTASTFLFANVITIFTFLLIFAFRDGFYSMTGFSSQISFFLFIYLFFQPAYSCWFYRQRVQYNYKSSVTASIVITTMSIASPIVALHYLPKTAENKFIFSLFPSIVIFTVFYIWQLSKSEMLSKGFLIERIRKIREYWKFLISFTPPLVIHALSFFILVQSDRIMIGKLDCKEHAALYSVACSISALTAIFQGAFQQVMLPWIYENLENRNYSNILHKTNCLILFLGLLYCIFILISPDLIFVIFPRQYANSIWCVPPIVFGSFFMFLYSLFVNVESYYEKTRYIAYVSVSCSILNIVLNYIGIPVFGYEFCAYSSLLCYMLFAGGHYFFMKKILSNNMVVESVFDSKWLLYVVSAMMFLLFIILIIYEYNYLRYSMLAIIALVFYMNKKRINVTLSGVIWSK